MSSPHPPPARPDPAAEQILFNVVAEIEAFAELDESLEDEPTGYVRAMRAVGVPYQPDVWFPGLTPARRKAYSRAARRLEGAGLVRRMTEPNRDRLTHLQLTPAGLRRALDLIGPGSDRTAVLEGLLRMAWTWELIDAIRK